MAQSSRVLRWAVSGLLLLVITGAVVASSSAFPLPAAVPYESLAAVQAVQGLAPDALVLAVFDYEPATVAEMETVAAPLMDHLLLLKHPRLAVVSTSPTGPVLADRFMQGTLAARTYVRGDQYVNLGFLAGGLTGVQSFAQDPVSAAPPGAGGEAVWQSTVLAGTRRLSDFAAIIVITDSLEGGRVWIEQTSGTRGAAALILVTSAQAAPVLLPYFDSAQTNGLVGGLNGAAGVELATGGMPGTVRQMWDAYALGLYAAAIAIALGAMWEIWNAIRARARGKA